MDQLSSGHHTRSHIEPIVVVFFTGSHDQDSVVYLTASNVAPWLIQRGLLDPESIVCGEFAFEEIERHNRGLRIYRPSDRAMYVKQLKVLDPHNIRCIQREAAFGQLLKTASSGQSFASFVPGFLDYDSGRYAVAFELILDAENLHQTMESCGEIPINVADDCAAAVALLESAEGRELASSLNPELCTGQPPWILAFHIDAGDGPLSRANDEFLQRLHEDSWLTSRLDVLREAWEPQTLMHGDLKWNNVLVDPNLSTGNRACRFVDWEMVDRGDSAWDVGTMLQSWWSWCVLSTPNLSCTGFGKFLSDHGDRFERTRGFTAAFLRNYLGRASGKAADPSPGSSNAELSASHQLQKCIQFGAVRLLQTIYELSQFADSLMLQAKLLLEMSRMFLERPQTAIDLTFGAKA